MNEPPHTDDLMQPDDTMQPDDLMQATPERAPGVCVAVLDGQAVLYDVGSARPVLLNTTASAVWVELDGHRTVAQVAALLAARFDADPALVAADVVRTITEFAALGLVSLVVAASKNHPTR